MPLRIMSSYKFSNDKIWIITKADRSVTTIDSYTGKKKPIKVSIEEIFAA